jgi:hypothetical protein
LALDASKSDDAILAGPKLSRIKFDQGSQIFTPEPFAADVRPVWVDWMTLTRAVGWI